MPRRLGRCPGSGICEGEPWPKRRTLVTSRQPADIPAFIRVIFKIDHATVPLRPGARPRMAGRFPAKTPSKSKAEFARERREKIASLIKQGRFKSERIKQALLKVPREDFIPEPYQDYAYLEVPLPLPGSRRPSPVYTAIRTARVIGAIGQDLTVCSKIIAGT